MGYSYEMAVFGKLYPEITWAETETIRQYWPVFYKDPHKYKGTILETIIFDWLKGDGKQIVEKIRED